jgi:molecular chaperone HscB
LATYFELLDVPVAFALDAAALERNYLARSRELHPDFHQLSSTSQQRASLELTAALNDAYNILRDPFKRADYLLGLMGGPQAGALKEMAPSFLEEMLELRMEIEELRDSRNEAGLAALEKQLQQRREAIVADLAANFGSNDLRGVRLWLNTARYIQGLLRDLRADHS